MILKYVNEVAWPTIFLAGDYRRFVKRGREIRETQRTGNPDICPQGEWDTEKSKGLPALCLVMLLRGLHGPPKFFGVSHAFVFFYSHFEMYGGDTKRY